MPISGQSAILTKKDKKLRELALYIAEKSQGDETFGATKLNKLLFYADFLAYLNFGKAITEIDYFKLPNGPVPRRWLPIKEAMKSSGDAKFVTAEFHGFPQNKLVPLRSAELHDFDGSEIALVDKLIEIHKGKTASEISDESHGFIGWILADEREVIPYEVALVSRRALSEKEVLYGKGLQKFAEKIKRAA